ncbi:hypothetical protein [Pseudomonas aeruginosa]|nr:hypothetical protein [Pseudomonas aeruginosa]
MRINAASSADPTSHFVAFRVSDFDTFSTDFYDWEGVICGVLKA